MSHDAYGCENSMVARFDGPARTPDPDCMSAAKEQMEREIPAFTSVAATDDLIRALEEAMGLLPTEKGVELALLRGQLMCARKNQRSAA